MADTVLVVVELGVGLGVVIAVLRGGIVPLVAALVLVTVLPVWPVAIGYAVYGWLRADLVRLW